MLPKRDVFTEGFEKTPCNLHIEISKRRDDDIQPETLKYAPWSLELQHFLLKRCLNRFLSLHF